MKNLYKIALLLFAFSVSAQQNLENANWIFGTRAWLDFNNNTVQANTIPPYSPNITSLTPEPGYNTVEGCASISDEDGKLLFFTDGRRVYRIANNQVEIEGYTGVGSVMRGNGSSAQNVIIIPMPGNQGLYYIITLTGFSADGEAHTTGLYWSEFNALTNTFVGPINNAMSDGTVTFDTTFNNRSEALTSCIAANGTDMWIIVHMENGIYSRVLSYLVTQTGISVNPAPGYSNLQPLNTSLVTSKALKVSPDTQRIALCNGRGNPLLGTFDNSTGAINLGTPVGNTALRIPYGLEFSQDSQTLFYSRENNPVCACSGIFAIDVNNPAVESTVFSNINYRYGMIQRGLDDNLYVANSALSTSPTTNTMLEVDNPASFGTWNVNVVPLNRQSRLGLPQWIWKTCQTTLTLTTPADDINGTSSTRERSQWIDASNIISAPTSNNVIYHAGQYVDLTPGFDAQNGSRFTAYIEGCSGNFSYKNSSSQNNSTTVETDLVQKSFVLYPNPSDNTIDIMMKNAAFNKITITATDGRTILDKAISATYDYQVDVSRYAKGIYIVTIMTEQGQVLSQKLIKN